MYWRQIWVSASSSSVSAMGSRPGKEPQQKRSAQTKAPASYMSFIKSISSTSEPTRATRTR